MSALTILIIRHAEKPGESWPGSGLTPDGIMAQLVTTVVGQTGVVLVAWEHKAIARAILPAIANGQSLPGMPTKWDGTRFDVVLRFDRTSPEAPWSFRQLCPCLLSGDSANPMG